MLLEALKILSEDDESFHVTTRADLRDGRKASCRRKWEHFPAKNTKPKRRRGKSPAEQEQAKAHKRLHKIVKRICQTADEINTRGRGHEFDDHEELINFLASQGTVSRIRAAGTLANNEERIVLNMALDFGQTHDKIRIVIKPDGKRLLVSMLSSPEAALHCNCSDVELLAGCA